MNTPVLQVNNLLCGYDGKAILDPLSFSVQSGQSVVLLGHNGVGKTTLFKTILRLLPSIGGTMQLGGQDITNWSRKQFAKEVAYVPQVHEPAFGFTAREIVLMGRTPALEGMASPSKEDEGIADDVLQSLGYAHLAARDYTTLSGGERQMILIARALAQQPTLLLMDEPCANLDLGNQIQLLQRILELNAKGLAIVLTSHDPNHAYLLNSQVVALVKGGKLTWGSASETLDENLLYELYNVQLERILATSKAGESRYNCLSYLSSTTKTK